jgi:hypothetical protein
VRGTSRFEDVESRGTSGQEAHQVKRHIRSRGTSSQEAHQVKRHRHIKSRGTVGQEVNQVKRHIRSRGTSSQEAHQVKRHSRSRGTSSQEAHQVKMHDKSRVKLLGDKRNTRHLTAPSCPPPPFAIKERSRDVGDVRKQHVCVQIRRKLAKGLKKPPQCSIFGMDGLKHSRALQRRRRLAADFVYVSLVLFSG